MELTNALEALDGVDIFKEANKEEFLVGNTFYIDYSTANLLVSDAWKQKVGGLPQGSFLLAFYENEGGVNEALLLRVIKPTTLPTDSEVIGSMIEYYKDDLATTAGASASEGKIDSFTRYHFSWSGLNCRILGTFYKDDKGKIQFGADVENFFSANNYKVYKPQGKILEYLVNFRDGSGMAGGISDARIGKVRFSSSQRFKTPEDVVVYVSPTDFLGKRSALFGMTRTGKSNTVKKIIQATVQTSDKAKHSLTTPAGVTSAYDVGDNNTPSFPVGQIIFDINGEYANENLQDAGTAISKIYKKNTVRYSVLDKTDFRIMKVNFYNDMTTGLGMLTDFLREQSQSADYVTSFTSINLEKPEDYNTNAGAKIRYDRLRAAYQCVLYKAGFTPPTSTVHFTGSAGINEEVRTGGLDPKIGISWQDAVTWWEWVWEHQDNEFFKKYKKDKGHDWTDQDLQSTLIMLTGKKTPTSSPNSGYKKLQGFTKYHTERGDKPFTQEIVDELREGKIVIIDLSQGDPDVQKNFSERICRALFQDSMNRFIENKPTNFVQMYFEEAQNIFPKKEEKDLTNIYNRIAKEGAKLSLGLLYATQEVSSISSNILKNTQNWFIAHLNNEDEIRELRKYYDFADFADSLVKFSASTDKGFVRMKAYSNAFIVPIQIDKFAEE
jgi:DNA helicase HerA-like ATPase